MTTLRRSRLASALTFDAPFGTDRLSNDLVTTEGGFAMPRGVYIRTPEVLAKIKAAMNRPEVLAKMAAARVGRRLTIEHRAKISAAGQGNTNSLGFKHSTATKAKHSTHKMCGTPTYGSWSAMNNRCRNPSAADYKRYGARGITVCERWTASGSGNRGDAFANFYADMGERPEGKTLDRIDNDGNYEPGNCRWATPKEQAANRRRAMAVAV